jgi:copper chaperone CopZ
MRGSVRDMVLRAEDILCAGCAEDMETVLRETEGIVDASVNYSEGSISVTYDQDLIDRGQVFAKVRQLGFPVKVVSEGQPGS